MERRLVAVGISFDFLLQMMTQGFKCGGFFEVHECVEGLPEGAILVRSGTEGDPKRGLLVFEHPSFELVPEGAQIPERWIKFRTNTAPVFNLPTTREEAVGRAIRRAANENRG